MRYLNRCIQYGTVGIVSSMNIEQRVDLKCLIKFTKNVLHTFINSYGNTTIS